MRKEAVQKDRLELLKIDSDLQTVLRSINTQRQNARQAEAKEIASALSEAKKEAMSRHLRVHALTSYVVSGIGPALKQRLIAQDIHTAADILNVQITQTGWGRYSNDIAYIVTRGHGSIRVDGIGPKKAQALLNWKKRLEANYAHLIPQSLDPSEQARISLKHKALLDSLEYQEAAARQASVKKKTNVQEANKISQSNLNTQIQSVQTRYLNRRRDLEKQYINYQKSFIAGKDEFGRLQRELFSYRFISFPNFIKRIFFMR
jgi:DNA-binding helix-hairpin-helix protein with protein kinase domain